MKSFKLNFTPQKVKTPSQKAVKPMSPVDVDNPPRPIRPASPGFSDVFPKAKK